METEKGEVMVEEERATGEKTEETGDRRGTMCMVFGGLYVPQKRETKNDKRP